MHHNNHSFSQPLGTGGAHIILIQIVQHRGTHETADLGRNLKGQNHHWHDHLIKLHLEARPIVDHMRSVINRWEPPKVHRKNHNDQYTRKKRRYRIAHHRNKCPRLIKYRILAIGRIDTDWDRNKNAHDVGDADHPKGLWNTLNDDFHHGAAGLPRDYTQFALRKCCSENMVHQDLWFDPEKLHNPFPKTNMNGFTQSKREAHFFLHFLWNGERNLRHRIARCQF